MKVIMMVVTGIIILSIAILVGFKLYRDVMLMWDLKRADMSFWIRIKCHIFLIIERVLFQRDKNYFNAATKHLAGVYDCIALKDPDIDMANNILKEKTVLEILDYWNAPGGRIFKIRMDSTKSHKENVIFIGIKKVTKAAYNLQDKEIYHDSKKGTKLRIIK